MAVNLKQNNTSPVLQTTLLDGDGNAVNLTGATVTFTMIDDDGVAKVSDGSVTLVDAVNGIVKYAWSAADTDTVGEFSASFEVTYSDTTVETFPISSYIRVSILPEGATWTYNGTPGNADASGRRDAVRFLIGDTDVTDKQVFDAEIEFALAETGNGVYGAAAIVLRSLSTKFAKMASTTIETLKIEYGERSESYDTLARKYERMAKKKDGVGLPLAGGISVTAVDTAESDTDRVEPAFKVDQYEDNRS